MNIAFDLDGVVLDQDLCALRSINLMQDRKQAQELFVYYCLYRQIQLNPMDYISEGDKLFFITGREELVRDITERWQKKYFPQATLIMTDCTYNEKEQNEKIEVWYVTQAKKKAKPILDNKIDVFFEDTPQVVVELRKLCPNTKIIQYGGRF